MRHYPLRPDRPARAIAGHARCRKRILACYAEARAQHPTTSQETAMQTMQAMYDARRCSAVDALDHLRDGDMIIVPTGVGEPPTLLEALSQHHRRFTGVQVAQILAMRKFGYFARECHAHVRHTALFFGGASRSGGQGGWCDFIPNYFSEIPTLIERGLMPADVVFAMASTMSASGHFALSLGCDYTMAAVARARAVVLEVNPHVPFTHGQCHVHVSQVTALVESDEAILEVGLPAIGPVQEAIGRLVAEHIEDGSTLQIGYGGIPDAVVMQLADKRDLGIHTEMIGDGILRLVEAGAVNNSKKTLLPGKMVATFALGSRRLYEFMHQNPMLEMHPSNFTNDPYVAGQNDKLVTINASLQVDLLGQCGSESIGHLPYSGTGGQVDFVRAANRSRGGQSFIVLPSTAREGAVSRIVPTLSPGTHATTSKNDVNYVVTEWGVAQLRGKSAKGRAQALIAIAHPDFRPWLREEAKRMCVFS
jgi:acyl-CoA hydrolase